MIYCVPIITLHGPNFEPRTVRTVDVQAADDFDAMAKAAEYAAEHEFLDFTNTTTKGA